MWPMNAINAKLSQHHNVWCVWIMRHSTTPYQGVVQPIVWGTMLWRTINNLVWPSSLRRSIKRDCSYITPLVHVEKQSLVHHLHVMRIIYGSAPMNLFSPFFMHQKSMSGYRTACLLKICPGNKTFDLTFALVSTTTFAISSPSWNNLPW